ncbi:hypothetical protein NU08_2664 [Flavobacterium anhuiense]|uniref:Uncharacterized protein n=1 Tax=Flavobacterium anhuiense TaxID=459526 RepID=A0A444VXL3_9FLAO|nr:hypothetical protein [Flavobacterium anhuiense]RYJ38341.1 hypothetical protein NU08_2664 [Flavobacterium anhuiense]
MTNTQINFIIDIVSGIGTFISSIIALFALKEVIKQRRAMYQPKLYFNEFSLSVKGNPHSEKKSLYHYYLHNLHEPVREDSRKGYSVSAQFFFENIGYGVANNIKYEWTFDYIKAARMLCELNPKFSYDDDKKRKSLMIIFDNKFFNSYDYSDVGKTKKIDFIKPESLQQNFKPTSIPMTITDVHMDYVLLKNKMFSEECDRFNHEKFNNFPIPKLNISYHDIAGKKYVEEYLFNISCYNSFRQMDDKLINTEEDYASLCFYLK